MFSKNGTFELQLLFMKLDFLLILYNYCLIIFLCRDGSRVDASIPNGQAVHAWRRPVYHRCQSPCREWESCLLPMQRLQELKELSSNWVYTIVLDYQGVHANLYDMDYTWRGCCECSVGKRWWCGHAWRSHPRCWQGTRLLIWNLWPQLIMCLGTR